MLLCQVSVNFGAQNLDLNSQLGAGLNLFVSKDTVINYVLNMTGSQLAEIPFLKNWQLIKDCFEDRSRLVLEYLYNKAYGQASQQMNNATRDAFYGLYVDGSPLRFKNAEGFLKFNEVLGKGMSEREKVGLVAFWLGDMGRHYSYSRMNDTIGRFFKEYSGQDALNEYLQGRDMGICGDINGNAARILTGRLGFDQSPVSIFTTSIGHVVSLLKGREEYYLVDYSKAESLGKNLDLALDRVLTSRAFFTPFGGGIFREIAFDESATEKFLYNVIGLAEKEVQKGFSLSFSADGHGSIGGSANYSFGKIRLGTFILNAPPSLTDFEGAYVDYRGQSDNGKTHEGSVWLPRVYFAAMRANTINNAFPLLIGEMMPYLYKNRIGQKNEIKINPLSIDVSASSGTNIIGRLTTTFGFIHELGDGTGTDRISVKGDLRWVASDENLYDIRKIGVTPKITAGFVTGKSSVELGYAPESIGNLVDLSLSQGMNAWKLNVLFTLEAQLLEKIPGEKPRLVNGANLGVVVTFQ